MIRPVEYQGVVQRNQDVASLNQNENDKAYILNQEAVAQTKKETDEKVKFVNRKDNAENDAKKQDAKEKGQNEYFGDGGKKRKKLTNTQGSVKIKGTSRFDIKA